MGRNAGLSPSFDRVSWLLRRSAAALLDYSAGRLPAMLSRNLAGQSSIAKPHKASLNSRKAERRRGGEAERLGNKIGGVGINTALISHVWKRQ
ncbi:hypothetical protein TcWFU_001543 [Taenia crassiceps]|uniref:Uncharacterized protein n=1 Tax=Taenia crassiceps TaxID=6207 RepID=A0ABR4PYV9_9CEST